MSGASAVYGGGATGGIINIVTKKGVGGDTRFNTELAPAAASRAMRTTTCARRSRSAAATTCSTAAWPSPTRRTERLRRQWRPGTDGHHPDRPAVQQVGGPDGQPWLHFRQWPQPRSRPAVLRPGYDGDRGLDLGATSMPLRGRAPYSIKGGVDPDREPESKRHQFNATYHAPEVLGHDPTCRPTTATRRWPSIPSLPSATAIARDQLRHLLLLGLAAGHRLLRDETGPGEDLGARQPDLRVDLTGKNSRPTRCSSTCRSPPPAAGW